MKKSTLYAPRLRGDIDLGLEPSRIDGHGDKAWARVDFPGRRLPGLADQSIYETSATQKFEVGTRRIMHGRTIRYSRAGAALTGSPRARLAANGNWVPDGAGHLNENGFFGDLYAIAAIGAKYIDLETATAFAANFFKDAYLCSFGTTIFHQHYIVASDLGNGTYVRCYLDEPIYVENISATQGVEIWCNPYSNIIEGLAVQSFKSFVGLPLCGPVTSGHYFWLMTRGPVFVTPTGWSGTDCPGVAANYRDVYAWIDGTIKPAPGADPSSGYQRVGYLLSATLTDYGDAFIMLELE